MAIFKCKMCGGNLEITEEMTVCECEYCGTKQTVPKADDEKKMTLYERANRLRYNCEFDKAASVYESIVADFHEEAEAYWGLVLCRYGIEYVDDPATGKKVPTCHRSSFDSVMHDADFEMVMENADGISRQVYREEAKVIEEIRKGIIEVSGKEQPYDIFICYKETAEDGQRTIDSVLAQDVYEALIGKGYRVFFSRISLEDKLGTEYEPYIFAALNSAKIMLAFGTTYDYYNAVWVKNEWSRFLKLMATDKSKHLIPCYKNIDAYDIPKEFARLQGQDLGRVGAIQDLLRGIEKILGSKETTEKKAEPQQAVVNQQDISAAIASAMSANAGNNTDALLQRGYMALEDGDWAAADGFFEEVLNKDAQCAKAYVGKLLAKYKQTNIQTLTEYFKKKYETATTEKLEACKEDQARIDASAKKYAIEDYLETQDIAKLYPYDRTYDSKLASRKQQKTQILNDITNEKLLARARQYATGELASSLSAMLDDITATYDQRIKQAELEDEKSIESVVAAYNTHLNQADEKAQKLNAEAESRRASAYNALVARMKTAETIDDYDDIRESLFEMKGYRDTTNLAEKCQTEIQRIEEEQRLEEERCRAEAQAKAEKAKKIRRIMFIAVVATVALIVAVISIVKSQIRSKQYKEALVQYQSLKTAEVNDVVTFGNYNGNTEWIVLAKKNDNLLLVSKCCIGVKAYNDDYNDEDTGVTWKTCTLRKWLNREYLNSAFNMGEQKMICSFKINNPNNSKYNTNGGNDTVDKVFLLSIDEANAYFPTDESRKATLADGRSVWWWLRSPGGNSYFAARVHDDGSVDEYGLSVTYDIGAVRPALWIDISDF